MMTIERIVGLDVKDDEEYTKYRKAMKPILKLYGGEFGYDFLISDVLMSPTEDHINRLFTIRFPTLQHMQSFFSDSAYIKAQDNHLKNSINSRTLISVHKIDV